MTDATKPNGALDLADCEALDTAELDVRHPATGEPTGWRITFAGPGHPQVVALSDRDARKRLREEREKEQARVNNRKWKAEDRSPEEVRAENVGYVVDRIVAWTPVRINGEDVPFSRDAAMRLFTDPRKGWLLNQAADFVLAEQTFFKRSATT
jgi:hypothetical protein